MLQVNFKKILAKYLPAAYLGKIKHLVYLAAPQGLLLLLPLIQRHHHEFKIFIGQTVCRLYT
jgi:hypothetical protein